MTNCDSKRDVVKQALNHRRPAYIPWQIGFTEEAAAKLKTYYTVENLDEFIDNHFLILSSNFETFTAIGDDCVRDRFGVIWDRSIDKDIGVVREQVLTRPTLKGFDFPHVTEGPFLSFSRTIHQYPDRFRVFSMGFTLFERAWTLRGMENLLSDFIEHPAFVHELLDALAEINIEQIALALRSDIDCVHFGDDWGQQHGLLMGPKIWRCFLKPRLKRMYAAVKSAGKYVSIHSCGDVDELFDELIDIGVDLFNPFQPEVMDVFSLKEQYAGRLAFQGGLSTQRVLPYSTPAEVKKTTQLLLEHGAKGGYIFAPAHAVEGDVPVENMVAFLEALKGQKAYTES